MSIQSIGRFGDVVPQPATPKGAPASDAPKPDSLKLQTPPQQPATQPAREDVQEAIKALKDKVGPMTPGNAFEFSMDQETGSAVVRITDAQTGELIRQIPSKELVDIAKNLDKMMGLLLRQKA